MEVRDVIFLRKSVRSFKNVDISKDIILDIINCGRLAPSAKNRQPWYFVVVNNDIKKRIADLMLLNIPFFSNSVLETAKAIKEASYLILILKEKDDSKIQGDLLSIGACLENMCLRATDLGLASLIIRDIIFVKKEIMDLIQVSDLELCVCLALGISNENYPYKIKKELQDIVKWID